jgi:hypothetical protein
MKWIGKRRRRIEMLLLLWELWRRWLELLLLLDSIRKQRWER